MKAVLRAEIFQMSVLKKKQSKPISFERLCRRSWHQRKFHPPLFFELSSDNKYPDGRASPSHHHHNEPEQSKERKGGKTRFSTSNWTFNHPLCFCLFIYTCMAKSGVKLIEKSFGEISFKKHLCKKYSMHYYNFFCIRKSSSLY